MPKKVATKGVATKKKATRSATRSVKKPTAKKPVAKKQAAKKLLTKKPLAATEDADLVKEEEDADFVEEEPLSKRKRASPKRASPKRASPLSAAKTITAIKSAAARVPLECPFGYHAFDDKLSKHERATLLGYSALYKTWGYGASEEIWDSTFEGRSLSVRWLQYVTDIVFRNLRQVDEFAQL